MFDSLLISRNVRSALAALALVAALPSLAHAIPLFDAKVFPSGSSGNAAGNCTNGGADFASSSTGASAEVVCGSAAGAADGRAVAIPGHVGTRASALHLQANSLAVTMLAVATGNDTVIFSGPAGSTVTSIPAVLNLDFGGILNAAPDTSGFGSGASAIVQATAILNSRSATLLLVFSGTTGLECNPASGNFFNSFTGFGCNSVALTGGQIVSVPSVQVGVGVPVFFSLSLNSTAFASGTNASALADFSNSLEFPTGIDVFTLPAGFTANAGSYLVNNRFVNPSAVSEPASIALVALGLAGLGFSRRRLIARVKRNSVLRRMQADHK